MPFHAVVTGERAFLVLPLGHSLASFCAHSLTWKNGMRAERDGKQLGGSHRKQTNLKSLGGWCFVFDRSHSKKGAEVGANWKGKFVLTFPLLSHSRSKLISASDLERQGLLAARGGSWKQMFWSDQFETRTCPVEHCKTLSIRARCVSLRYRQSLIR